MTEPTTVAGQRYCYACGTAADPDTGECPTCTCAGCGEGAEDCWCDETEPWSTGFEH